VLVERRDASERPTPVAGPISFPVKSDDAQAPPKVIPDFRGLGAREAIRAVAQLGMTARVRGAGIVVDQQPAAGSPIERGTVATLTLERRVSANTEQIPSAETTP
jgi:beta-lactam-binding protein with PASTA domain